MAAFTMMNNDNANRCGQLCLLAIAGNSCRTAVTLTVCSGTTQAMPPPSPPSWASTLMGRGLLCVGPKKECNRSMETNGRIVDTVHFCNENFWGCSLRQVKALSLNGERICSISCQFLIMNLNWVAKIAAVVLYDTKLSNPIATTQKPLEGVQTLLTSNTGHRPLFTRD